ncbi:hypothetical protein K9M74_00675 [Candidatus Woesearchaeota archaeon]|nr:hypothetical protein [Candidatus Woesearchaeota archaeon]
MAIKDLFDDGTITLAKQPKNNQLDLERLADYNLLLIPIDHDYPGGSAAMHNAVFDQFLPNYKTAFVVANPKNAQKIFETFRNDPLYVGGGVGSGFKDKAIAYLDALDDSAKITGSVNVVKKENDKLIGYNTDGVGFYKGLTAEFPDAVKDKNIVLLGAGGTALPIAYELARAHPKQITVLNRTIAKAQKIAQLISPYTTAFAGGEEDIGAQLATANLVINTSNKGADPFKAYSAFGPITNDYNQDLAIAKKNISHLPKDAIVADILLEDLSKTLELAKNAGYKIHNGKSMNLYQAVPALKIMAPLQDVPDSKLESIMRDAL